MSGKDKAKAEQTQSDARDSDQVDESAQDAAERIVEEALREAESGAEAKDRASAANDAAGADAEGGPAEAGASADAEGGAPDPMETLRRENAELKDKMMRAVADAENTRRRAEKDAADARKYAASTLVKELLPAVDNLRRAVDSVPEAITAENEQVNNLVVGVEMTEKQILEAFEKAGIHRIDPQGEKFSYERHQAISETADTDLPDGTVAQVLQPGYMLHDRLLRPAMVVVAKGGRGGKGDTGGGDPSAGADEGGGVDTTA